MAKSFTSLVIGLALTALPLSVVDAAAFADHSNFDFSGVNQAQPCVLIMLDNVYNPTLVATAVVVTWDTPELITEAHIHKLQVAEPIDDVPAMCHGPPKRPTI